MTARPLPSPELLRKLLRYEPDTGKLFWYKRSISPYMSARACAIWNSRHAEKLAFTHVSSDGYLKGCVFNRPYFAHRVIWAMQTDAWPTCEIDHVDNDRLNNCWKNLRKATRTENMRNRKSMKGSTSRYLGAHWYRPSRKWRASLRVNGKTMHLGCFVSEIEAAKHYDEVVYLLYGNFANLNFPEVCKNA